MAVNGDSGGGTAPVQAYPGSHEEKYTPPDGVEAFIAGLDGAFDAAQFLIPTCNLAAEEAFLRCFPAGTLVATPRGLFPIETIRAGDEVWAYDLVQSRWRARRALRTFARPHDGTSATITVADEAIEATFLHPFWVVRGEDLANRPVREHLPAGPEGATTPGMGRCG